MIDEVMYEILKVVKKPVYICVGGSRMCGYEEIDSDWDILVVFEDQDELNNEFVTKRFFVEGNEISLRFEKFSYCLEKLNSGNIKLFEKMHSPFVWLSDIKGEALKEQKEKVDKNLLLNNYIEKIEFDLQVYAKRNYAKALIYAYRRTLTALELMNNNRCIIDYKTLNQLYPNSLIEELALCKINKRTLSCSEQAAKELKGWICELKQTLVG